MPLFHICRLAPSIKTALVDLWSAYSKPTPEACKEVLTLLLLCFVIAVVTGGILFNWMSQMLRYDHLTATTVAGLSAVAAFLLLSLVHPFRCVFTMILATLGTKQGHKLILSTCLMLLALNVIPNIAANVGVVAHVLKCTAGGLAQSLINSSELMNRAKGELVKEASQTNLDVTSTLRDFDHYTYINVSGVKQRFVVVSHHIERDFSHAKSVLEATKLVANRLLAAFFVVYLFVESACYLKGYLTNVKFDNVYITGQLLHMTRENGIQILPGNTKNIVYSTSYKISKQEFYRCLLQIVFISLYLVAAVFVVALDYIVYNVVRTSQAWLLDIPSTSISISILYKVKSSVPVSCLLFSTCEGTAVVDFQRVYPWNFSFGSGRCALEPSEPDRGVAALLGFLFVVAYVMVLLEVYARRMRRKVSSSFFKKQEEKRINFLFKKILEKQEKEKSGIFFIETT
ncbi:osteoclast stimulatory transmembrane protein [Megalops cyprinoides]|uniref:osteoclast stimulatory transmembrane protein n=1 Tax=Megalops cyprinoides TaxID=118141 RepID=UPI0018644EB8|nr:osteoclast stimulatory transmembrane protein [Megalops cyprinoides]